MGWPRLVGSLKLRVSFAEYSLFYRAILQKRPVILRSPLIVATPYLISNAFHLWRLLYGIHLTLITATPLQHRCNRSAYTFLGNWPLLQLNLKSPKKAATMSGLSLNIYICIYIYIC